MLWITLLELILAIGLLYTTQKNKKPTILFILLIICLIANFIIELI